MTITTTYNDQTITIERGEYADPFSNPLAVVAYAGDDLYDQLSVNLPAYRTSNEDCFFVSSDSFSHGLIRHLEDEGIIQNTGVTVEYGSFDSSATEYELLAD